MLKNKNKNSIPVWLMRQSGRYMPEYKKLRESSSKNFLELCYSTDKVVEITLQPIKRFNLDAAILFSDILILPHSLGWEVEFEYNLGPKLKVFKEKEDFKYFQEKPNKDVFRIYDAISKVRALLPRNISLIGFAGSSWTVVNYILGGGKKQNFSNSLKFLYEEQDLVHQLISLITQHTVTHLLNQIRAGCDVIQLFDSWAGILTSEDYDELVIKPTSYIVKEVKKHFPEILIIGYPRGSGFLYEKYILKTKIDVIGVDQFIPVHCMKTWKTERDIIVQGNLDPVILLTNEVIIKNRTYNILEEMVGSNYIFNLGHGILPETPIKNVEFVVNCVKNFKQ